MTDDNNNNNTEDADAQMARDLQLALDIQDQEEEEEKQRRHRNSNDHAAFDAQLQQGILGGGGGGGHQQQHHHNAGNSGGFLGRLMGLMSAGSAESRARNAEREELFGDGSSLAQQNSSLLYLPCTVHKKKNVQMMVDTGSQTSVISAPMMYSLGLERRLNTLHQGIAAGVGAAQILGRIENVPVKLGSVEFFLYFLVLDVPIDNMLILGIDQLRRFKCLIDLERNKLIFGGNGGVEVSFKTGGEGLVQIAQTPQQAQQFLQSFGGGSY